MATFGSTNTRETEDFIVCRGGADKDEIRVRFRDKINSVLVSLISEAQAVIGIKRLTDPVVFFREDGKPLYSYSFHAEAFSAYLPRSLPRESLTAIRERYRLLSSADTTLRRVHGLIITSLEAEHDPLRSFLAGW